MDSDTLCDNAYVSVGLGTRLLCMPLSVKVKSDLHAGLHVDIILTRYWYMVNCNLFETLFLDECCMNN